MARSSALNYEKADRVSKVYRDVHFYTSDSAFAFKDGRLRPKGPTEKQMALIADLLRKIEVWREATGKTDHLPYMPPETVYEAGRRIEYIKEWMYRHGVYQYYKGQRIRAAKEAEAQERISL